MIFLLVLGVNLLWFGLANLVFVIMSFRLYNDSDIYANSEIIFDETNEWSSAPIVDIAFVTSNGTITSNS